MVCIPYAYHSHRGFGITTELENRQAGYFEMMGKKKNYKFACVGRGNKNWPQVYSAALFTQGVSAIMPK
jgi:hypothetical protein